MNKPKLNSNQYALLLVDNNTGIVLNENLEYYNQETNDVCYLIFDEINKIEDHIELIKKASKDIEFVIYDYNYDVI